MAFNVLCKLENYETRICEPRTTKKTGKPFRVVRVESPDASYTAELTVWDEDLFPTVDSLKKGDVCDFYVRASGGSEFSGLTLLDLTNHGTGYAVDGMDY